MAEDVQRKIKNIGVRGMDMEKAKELGFFTRISNLLCASHASIMAAYRIYGNAASLINDFGGRRNDIAKAMNDYERAFGRFVDFWTNYYASGDAGKEINEETENLYHRIMEWAQIPENWELGDEQRTLSDGDTALKVDTDNGGTLYFHATCIDMETVGDVDESWCVTKYDKRHDKQETVNTNMDKASAIMVAKRLSGDDGDNIYTASIVRGVTERKTTVTPYRAFQNKETIGKITNIER